MPNLVLLPRNARFTHIWSLSGWARTFSTGLETIILNTSTSFQAHYVFYSFIYEAESAPTFCYSLLRANPFVVDYCFDHVLHESVALECHEPF